MIQPSEKAGRRIRSGEYVYKDYGTSRQLSLTAPDTLEKIRDSDAVAVCREPLSRFQSAIGQYLRNTPGRRLPTFHRLIWPPWSTAFSRNRADDLGRLPMTIFPAPCRLQLS
jgi:hypothetical protein